MTQWIDEDSARTMIAYKSRLMNRQIYDDALDSPFEVWYNQCVFEGAVEMSLTATRWEIFSDGVQTFYTEMEKAYHDVLANQPGER